MDGNYFTTMSFVKLAPDGERVFSFARKLGADTQIRKEELNGDILDNTKIFATGSLALTDEPEAHALRLYRKQRITAASLPMTRITVRLCGRTRRQLCSICAA